MKSLGRRKKGEEAAAAKSLSDPPRNDIEDQNVDATANRDKDEDYGFFFFFFLFFFLFVFFVLFYALMIFAPVVSRVATRLLDRHPLCRERDRERERWELIVHSPAKRQHFSFFLFFLSSSLLSYLNCTSFYSPSSSPFLYLFDSPGGRTQGGSGRSMVVTLPRIALISLVIMTHSGLSLVSVFFLFFFFFFFFFFSFFIRRVPIYISCRLSSAFFPSI